MAFCKYCGAALEEGQVCQCPQAQAARQQEAQPNVQAAAADTAKNLGSYLSNYFTDAGQAVRQVVEQDNITFAVILAVIRALAMGLAVYGLLRKSCSIAYQTALMTMGGFGYSGGMMGTSIKAPLLGSLLYGALIGLAGMVLFVLMVFLLSKLLGGSASLKAAFEASAANGILPTALLLIAFLLSFASLPLAVGCMVLAALSWVVCGVLTAQLLCGDNVSGKFWVLYFVGVVLVFWLGGMILPNLFLGAVGGITVSSGNSAPFTLKQSIDMLKMHLAQIGGWSGLIRELMDEIF